MGRFFSRVLVVWLVAGWMAACDKAEPDPIPSLDMESIQAASTLFAQPTRSLPHTPTPTPTRRLELDLNRTVAQMERAVLAGDVASYLENVWHGDPLFTEEHRRWAQDWQAHPLRLFMIDLYGIQALSPDRAAARMTTLWSQRNTESAGGATASVLFRRDGDRWLLAGERWVTIDRPGFRLYYFADEMVDNELPAQMVLDYLPSIMARLNETFDVVPKHPLHIKLYDNAVTLQNWTRLSMPGLDHWNEPGEAIKLAVGETHTAPTETQVAAEYTRFLLYEMAGGTHGAIPWWLAEGISTYGGALFQTRSRHNRIIEQVAALVTAPPDAAQHLLAWADLDKQPVSPSPDWQMTVNQAYTLVHYITEIHGPDRRNTWIAALAAGQTLEAATQTHLGLSMDGLDSGWRTWLAASS